jgi:outer membrane cobalamin receptor
VIESAVWKKSFTLKKGDLLLVVVTLFAASLLPSAAKAQVATAERLVVEADRLPDAESSAPFIVHVIDKENLRDSLHLRVDDVLRAEVPGFSLFRRNSSRTANPTTQGVTLRNFGPSGAGRTLVLLDGISLNDPLAGYVLWSQVPTESLESILVQPASR